MTVREAIARYGAHLLKCEECDSLKLHYCQEGWTLMQTLYTVCNEGASENTEKRCTESWEPMSGSKRARGAA